MPPCPSCGETVSRRARKCSSCDEDLRDEDGESVFDTDEDDGNIPFHTPAPKGYMAVVGESHYQDAISAVAARCGHPRIFRVGIAREPSNPYDANALRVFDPETDSTLGYLAKGTTGFIRRTAHGPFFCEGEVKGGTSDKPHFGLVIHIYGTQPDAQGNHAEVEPQSIDRHCPFCWKKVPAATVTCAYCGQCIEHVWSPVLDRVAPEDDPRLVGLSDERRTDALARLTHQNSLQIENRARVGARTTSVSNWIIVAACVITVTAILVVIFVR